MARLYVATDGDGLWGSDDLGASWVKEAGITPAARLYSLHAAAGEVLAGGQGRVFRRRDGAWSEWALPDPDAQVWAVAAVEGVILAGTRPLGLWRSEDGGRTWQAVEATLPPGTPAPHTPRVTALLPNPAVAGEVWAGIEVGGVLASVDRGRTWQAASHGLPSLDVHSLAWASGSVLLAALPVGVAMWRSARWHPCHFQADDRYCRALAVRSDDPGVVYCGFGDGPPGTRGGVARSADGGRTWQAMRLLPGAESAVWAMATSRTAADLVLAAAYSGRVFVSRDGGEGWEAVLRTAAPARAAAVLDA